MARWPRLAVALALAALAWLPAQAGTTPRPRFEPTDLECGRQIGFEGGLDLRFKLDHRDRFGLTGELGATHFISPDPDQFQATLGFVWSVRPTLDLSLCGLLGTLSGGDRYGLLLGVSPKVRLFK